MNAQRCRTAAWILTIVAASAAGSRATAAAEVARQGVATSAVPRGADEAPAPESRTPLAADRAIAILPSSIEFLLGAAEGVEDAEWPYEGVYRVRGAIPIGYRVGGTSIVARMLLLAPGAADDARRLEAIRRAVAFVIDAADHPLMDPTPIGTYDTRGWGWAYGLHFLLEVRRTLGRDAIGDRGDAVIRTYVERLEGTVIPGSGGWNYARRGGFDRPGPSSPFMTASTLEALGLAAHEGFPVDADVIAQALVALEQARTDAGAFVYAGAARPGQPDQLPGAVGRMLAAELLLHLHGRSSVVQVRGALDAFLVHWERLEERRARTGTHEPPYGVAPYYFFYAHRFAARAIEVLPPGEREEYRRHLRARLFQVRGEDGTWNDRVFPRSRAYATAMAMEVILAPSLAPIRVRPAEAEVLPDDAGAEARPDARRRRIPAQRAE